MSRVSEPDPNQPDEGSEPSAHLCPKSDAAMQALVDARFDPAAVPPEHKARCMHIDALLGPLNECLHPKESAETLWAKTIIRLRGQAANQAANQRGDVPLAQLCPDDDGALELLVSEHFETRHITQAMRPRAERISALLKGLDRPSVPITDAGRDELVSRVLTAVQAQRTLASSRVHIHEASPRGGRHLRFIDLSSIAALFVVGAALLWPTVSAMRQRAMQVAGASRMGSVGSAVGQYALDHNAALPMASASLAGRTWWNVGKPEESNSANLFTLRRTGYASLEQLASPGNAKAQGLALPPDAWDWPDLECVSYSYQNQFATQRRCMNDRAVGFIILADKSPVALRAWRGELVVYADENSPNFAGRGQNVLHSDGQVVWLQTPSTASGDDLWLPASIERGIKAAQRKGQAQSQAQSQAQGNHEMPCQALRGVEQPETINDTFLCP